jgi:hypothetical protein
MKAWPVELTLEDLDLLLAMPLEASIRHKMDAARAAIMRRVVSDCGGTLIEADLRPKEPVPADLFLEEQLQICGRQGHKMQAQWVPCTSKFSIFECTSCGADLHVTCSVLPNRDAAGAALHSTCHAHVNHS